MGNLELGKRIEMRRTQLNLTLDDIASEIGVAKSTVQRYEKGSIEKIKLPVIEAIARVLDVNPAWLCGKTETMAAKPTPASEGEPHVNIVKIAGRDGSFVEKRLTDKQLQALRSFVDLLPDASDDL